MKVTIEIIRRIPNTQDAIGTHRYHFVSDSITQKYIDSGKFLYFAPKPIFITVLAFMLENKEYVNCVNILIYNSASDSEPSRKFNIGAETMFDLFVLTMEMCKENLHAQAGEESLPSHSRSYVGLESDDKQGGV